MLPVQWRRLYAYFIIWSGDDGNDPAKDEQIPDGLVLDDLLEGAKQLDLSTTVQEFTKPHWSVWMTFALTSPMLS